MNKKQLKKRIRELETENTRLEMGYLSMQSFARSYEEIYKEIKACYGDLAALQQAELKERTEYLRSIHIRQAAKPDPPFADLPF